MNQHLRRATRTSFVVILAGCSSTVPVVSPPIEAHGAAYLATQQGGVAANAQVSILELPDRQTTTGADGSFSFTGLPADTDLTFLLQGEGLMDTLTGTFHSSSNLEAITFQAPDNKTYDLLATLVGIKLMSDRCQIATTLTRQGVTGNDTGGNGEIGARASITPALPSDARGPVYFNTYSTTIYPDTTLSQATSDGGVLFLNVPPGDYTIDGHKPGVTFSQVHIKCMAGRLTNASPPWGVAALTGGLGPRSDGGS